MRRKGKSTGHRGHPRFAIRGAAGPRVNRSKDAPWFLKGYGSRPAYKRHRLAEAA